MCIHEIVLPKTKPETERVRGRALQKTGGTYAHGAVQTELAMQLLRWSRQSAKGRVAIEWRFRVAPAAEIVRPLVPDLAFLSYDALPADAPDEEVQVPIGAPTVVFEVLAAEDQRADLDDKVRTYLRAGTSAVIFVDPETDTIRLYDRDGVRKLRDPDHFVHGAMPEFELNVGALFTTVKADTGR